MRRWHILLLVAMAAAVVLAVAAGPAAALVPNGTHGWYWQMPQPAGSTGMEDLSFPTATDVWAVGFGGLVQHSADGGQTWTVQPTGSDADLWSVDFVDGQYGAVCGDVLLVTGDGGKTWTDRTPPASLAEGLMQVSMTDSLHLWVSTADGGVLSSGDGGATWRRNQLSGYHDSVLCDFVDGTHGWASGDGDRVWRTVDGGAEWRLQVAGAGPRGGDTASQVKFADGRHGWALDWTADGEAMVRVTADAGRSWRRVMDADPSTTSLVPTGPSSAWLIAPVNWYDSAPQVTLQHTTDLGRHLGTRVIGAPAAPYMIAAHGASLCAVGDGVLVSGDDGATWRAASSGQDYTFTAIQALSPSNVWATDISGALLHSSDGVRWAEQDDPARYAGVLYGVSFPDAKDGWVVGSGDQYGFSGGVILHTADGGATWAPQSSNLAGQLVGVQFVDKLTGWTISSDPSGFFGAGAATGLERTLDGGQTWIPLFVPGNPALLAVRFLDADTGWVAGALSDFRTGGILKTTDGGFTWKRQTLPKGTPPLTSLWFTDANTGWALGVQLEQDTVDQNIWYPHGWVLHTTDGGKTWARVPDSDAMHTDTMLGSTIAFSDAQHGWIGGDGGLFATTDGGTTWQAAAGAYGVTALAATDAQHVWAAGFDLMLSTVNGSGDSAAPATVLDGLAASATARSPRTLDLLPSDMGGSGLAGSEYRIDGQPWQPGRSVLIDAPADHSYDGAHAVFYRATDAAGNREGTEMTQVFVDTLGPACTAPKPSIVDAGKTGLLYFKATDATTSVAKVTLDIKDKHRKTVKRIVVKAGYWAYSPERRYYWQRFRCDLAPGRYRLEVRAVDNAGNPQVTVGHNVLRVVRSGAPPQVRPHWPQGLPFESYGFTTRQGLEVLSGRRFMLRGVTLSLPLPYRVARLR